jgi:hypothetical protein
MGVATEGVVTHCLAFSEDAARLVIDVFTDTDGGWVDAFGVQDRGEGLEVVCFDCDRTQGFRFEMEEYRENADDSNRETVRARGHRHGDGWAAAEPGVELAPDRGGEDGEVGAFEGVGAEDLR